MHDSVQRRTAGTPEQAGVDHRDDAPAFRSPAPRDRCDGQATRAEGQSSRGAVLE